MFSKWIAQPMASGRLGKAGRYDTVGEMNSACAFDHCWVSDQASSFRSCYFPPVRTEIEERPASATFEALDARKVCRSTQTDLYQYPAP